MNESTNLPDFERPPLVEVVCGITFKELGALKVPHFGRLWERYLPDYATCEEVVPLAAVVETYEDQEPRLGFELTDRPPLPRIWFVHERETGIIQVQRDRFLHNWKRVRPEDEYPRYPSVMQLFFQHLDTFEAFLASERLGQIEAIQLELAYVNQIPISISRRPKNTGELSVIFPDFSWREDKGRFLPSPEDLNYRMTFRLPGASGRLHTVIRTGRSLSSGEPILSLELTARGMSKSTSREGMRTWFDLAREWIVRGFADLTDPQIQVEAWGVKR